MLLERKRAFVFYLNMVFSLVEIGREMSKIRKIIIIGSSICGTIALTVLFISLGEEFFPREDVPTMREGGVIAESWIRNFSPTYTLSGKDIWITNSEEIERGEYEFVFSFITESPEYGTHENEMKVRTKNTEVVSAITNGIFDEISGNYLEKEETVDLYFVIEEEEERSIRAVERSISVSAVENIEEVLLAELFKGPSVEEKEAGYLTFIEDATRIFSFRVENGTAFIELSTPFDQQPEIAAEQIKRTLLQIDGVSEVRAPERRRRVTLEIEGVPEDFLFTEDLDEGSEGVDVRYLQIVLNADPETMVAQQGPGSPGEEVESFGSSTTHAVMAFQRKYDDEILKPAGLILSTGIVDEHTRDKLNSILEESRW